MCKTGHEHAANKKTHKPRVHTRHDNMKARSQWLYKLRATQHKIQHKCTQPIETRTACNTTKPTWTRVRGAERTRDRALTQWQKMERECPNPVTWPKLKTWVPGSKHHAPTWNKARRRESARHEHTRSHALTWKRGHDVSIRALSQNHE